MEMGRLFSHPLELLLGNTEIVSTVDRWKINLFSLGIPATPISSYKIKSLSNMLRTLLLILLQIIHYSVFSVQSNELVKILSYFNTEVATMNSVL